MVKSESVGFAVAPSDNGRNSDNTKIMEYLGWAPDIKLRDGMAKTYAWIDAEYQKKREAAAV